MADDDWGGPWSLPTTRVTRKHSPRPGEGERGYQRFRPCLRWEFDFTCIYCRLRETDFGYRSEARFCVEHLWPREHFAHLANDYTNCYYACGSCNSSKGDTYPSAVEEAQGLRFFNPCEDVAAEHFSLEEDTIVAKPGSQIAQYTLKELRNINREEPTKQRRRRTLRRIRELTRLRGAVSEARGREPRLCDDLLRTIDTWLRELRDKRTLSPTECPCGAGTPGP